MAGNSFSRCVGGREWGNWVSLGVWGFLFICDNRNPAVWVGRGSAIAPLARKRFLALTLPASPRCLPVAGSVAAPACQCGMVMGERDGGMGIDMVNRGADGGKGRGRGAILYLLIRHLMRN